MAQAMASMSNLLEGSLQISGSSRLARSGTSKVGLARPAFVVRAQQGSAETETSRRAVLGLVVVGLGSGAFVQAVLAEATPIKIGPPPPPSGGLPGTENSDEARDLDLPLKNRFFLQSLTPTAAAERAKESAQDIVNVKAFIDKKAWPYVQNDLRSKAGYLRFDLNTVIASKPKEQKVALKALTGKLFQDLDKLDYAAKIKSSEEATKYYDAAVSSLKDVLANLG